MKQAFARLARYAFKKHGRHMKAKQFRRALKEQKRIKTCAGRVSWELGRKLTDEAYARNQRAMILGELALAQQRKTKGKVYSLHAPEVECFAKG